MNFSVLRFAVFKLPFRALVVHGGVLFPQGVATGLN